MRVLVTGSAGHLGEALVRTLRGRGDEVVSLDIVASPFTSQVGSVTDRAMVRTCMAGVEAVFHAATLHKPHVATHSRQDFVDTNITGTLNLLEEAAAAGVRAFVYTSTTSVFGDAMTPADGAPAVWITEDVVPRPKNIYGATKAAAEDLCRLFHRNQGLACVVLRTSRFFLDEDDDRRVRAAYPDANVKTNEFLFRRVDLQDVVDAHLLALEAASDIGFGCYIVSATTPFAPSVTRRRVPDYEALYAGRGWRMFPRIGRVYANDRARRALGWRPKYDFAHALERLRANEDFFSPLARTIGAKLYHAERFDDGPYPVEEQAIKVAVINL